MSFHYLRLDLLTDVVAALKLFSVGRTFVPLWFDLNMFDVNMNDSNMKGFA